MDRPGPVLSGFPDRFPVFPLAGALLLPGGRLPLNIFEPRYLALVEDALAGGRMFAMIQPDDRKPVGPTGPGLYTIGCLGRISSFSESDDGRYLITLSGLLRFGVMEELPMQRGYRRIRADLHRFASDLAPEEDVSPRKESADRETRARLLDALRGYFARRGFEANWEAIEQMTHDTLVATLSMVCPFQPAEKQALLEAPTQTDRTDALLALLRIDAHSTGDDDVGDKRSLMS